VQKEHSGLIKKIYTPQEDDAFEELTDIMDENDSQNDVEILELRNSENHQDAKDKYYFAEEIEEEETLSIKDKELELIKKALDKNQGKRKAAADELGVSERTLYRKIKQFGL
jgi:transcriptional regulator with PAS, ATPase and Fis domain